MSDRFRCTTCSPLLDCMVFDGGMLSIASHIRTEDGRACTRRHLIQQTKRYHQPSPLYCTPCHAHFIISSMLAWRLQGVSDLIVSQPRSLLLTQAKTRAFNIGEFVDNQPQQPIPKSLQGHEDELLDFKTRCRKTCHRILRLLALGLEVGSLSSSCYLSAFLHKRTECLSRF